jgi:hypothetical protein
VRELLVDLTPLADGANLPSLLHRLGLPHEPPPQTMTDMRSVQAQPAPHRVNRRAVLVGSAVGIPLAAFLGRRLWRSTSSVHTGQWRPLMPIASPLLLTFDDAATWTYDPAGQVVSIISRDYAFVTLGRPLQGVFSFRTEWKKESPRSRVGIFFRHRQEVRNGELVVDFHLVEWLLDGSVPRRGGLEWSHMVVRQTATDETAERKLWASTFADAPNETCQLQVTLGLDGFPRILWNGKLLPESRWKLSSEGRRKTQIAHRRLRTDYLGSLGLLASHGATFHRPELMYHDVT